MRGALPIIKREYLVKIRSKGFWISTALLPMFTIAMALIPLLVSETKSSDDPIMIVDFLGDYFPVFEESLERVGADEQIPPIWQVEIEGRSADEIMFDLNEKAEKGEIGGYFILDDESVQSEDITFFARSPSSAIGQQELTGLLAESIRKYRLRQLGVDIEGIEAAIQSVGIDVKKATNNPNEKDQSGTGAFLTSFGMVMFIYFALIFYGVHVLRGVLEEKTSRIVEIIVSTTRPFDLMMGKIVGIGAAGLTQVMIWVLFGALTSLPSVGSALAISKENLPSIPIMSLVFFPVYFILGFFLYATMYAGIGAMFNSEEDAQQMTSFATMMLVIPLMVMTPVIKNPSGGLATALSMFPFFTPILMYLRIGVEMPPVWQIVLSTVIMIVTIFVAIWFCAKIYRVGILMYGKKPTIPEIFRWLRYT